MDLRPYGYTGLGHRMTAKPGAEVSTVGEAEGGRDGMAIRDCDERSPNGWIAPAEVAEGGGLAVRRPDPASRRRPVAVCHRDAGVGADVAGVGVVWP